MKLHKRFFIVRAAATDLEKAITQITETHGLTEAETLAVVNKVLSGRVEWAATILIRQERHGTTTKKGDEA